ncbi:hypothetical protein DZC30_20465 [Comamonas testosteroni]|uniref:Type II secretion system protein GspF domain-containing protein n=1 Tax=Comamonas testosteroni TaxID=285 RepID=A0A373FAI1_COMTE|nr:hypothetical protein [Comamonas testosteroni]RGE40439.1 hypothetical protein DZC30_20465 [Comamonas testosteroni]
MNLSTIFHYYHLIQFSFTRHIFYLELADSWKRSVSLKNFAYRVIDNGKVLKDETRIHVGKKLISSIEESDTVGLWASLKNLVSKSDWPLLKAAEISKDIPAALTHISKTVAFKINVTWQLVKSMGVALFVALICAAVIGVTADTIAKILDTAPNMKFTGFNGLVVTLAGFFVENWKLVSGFIFASIALVVYYAPRLTGPLREKLDEWPVFSLYRDVESANAIAMLSMYLSSGLVLKDAVNRLSIDGTPWRKWQVSKIANALDSRPSELIYAFSRGLFSPKLRARLAALADSSSAFEDAIITLGRDELERIEKEIQTTVIATAGGLVFGIAFVAVILSLGQQTIISQLYNDFSKGY